VLLVPDEELEGDGCALADIADTANETTLSAIAESKTIRIVLLSLLLHSSFLFALVLIPAFLPNKTIRKITFGRSHEKIR
jgi:hypothetical protein